MSENRPPAMNIVQFAETFGGKTDADVDGHIHAGLRSLQPRYRKWYEAKLKELQDARDLTTRRYNAAIAAGTIERPSQRRLEETAKLDTRQGAAARRVIAKRAAYAAAMAAAEKGEKP